MDWPKIKTVLLVLLVFTNVILAVMLIQSHYNFNVLGDKKIEEIKAFYAENGMKILDERLTFPSNINAVRLNFESYDFGESTLKQNKLFDMDKLKTYFSPKQQRVSTSDTFIISDTGKWHRKTKGHVYEADSHDVDAVEAQFEIVRAFMKQTDFKLEFTPVSMMTEANTVVIEAKQSTQGILIEEVTAYFWVQNDRVVSFKLSKPAKITNDYLRSYDIITIDLALYRGIHLFKRKEDIVDIALVYRLNNSDLTDTIVSGEALPYYRIKTTSGAVYFFEAVES
ncbi:hypothetical protein ACR6HW_10130 [Fusibacter sp. JL298sf-3]